MLGSGYTSIEPNSWIQNCQNDGMPYKTGQLSFNGILLEPRTDIVLHRPQELCIQRLHSATVWLIYRLTGQVCTVKMLPAMGVRHGLRTSNSLPPHTTVQTAWPQIHHQKKTTTCTPPDCNQPTQSPGVVGAAGGKTWSSRDFTTMATHLNHQCSCLLSNNNKVAITH